MVNRTHQPAEKNTEKSKRPSGIGRRYVISRYRVFWTGGVERSKASLSDFNDNRSYVALNEPDTVDWALDTSCPLNIKRRK